MYGIAGWSIDVYSPIPCFILAILFIFQIFGRKRRNCGAKKRSEVSFPVFKHCMVILQLSNFICSICGTLHSVDQYLNIKLTDISVTDPEKYPHMLSVKNCFIRGSVVKIVTIFRDGLKRWINLFENLVLGAIHSTARRRSRHTIATRCGQEAVTETQ